MFSRIHLPRLTGDVRVGLDVAARMLACVSTPPRAVPASETRRNSSPVTPGDAVVPGEPFVDERVIRVEELEHAAVFVLDRLEEELASPRASPTSATRRNRGTRSGRA